jgi:tetraacyldisaccharide 4'-kinase
VRVLLILLLLPFSALYWLGLRFDRWRRGLSAQTLSKPVISIGNLTVGGTGKTPLLIYLTEYLTVQSRKTAVLTRGYAGFNHGDAASGNDEAMLLKKRCPTVLIGAGADRARSAQNILNAEAPDVFLLDDGFQHWPLKRSLDLVCVDATDPWGGGWLLPAGRLREPRRALRRANAVVVTRGELVSDERRAALVREIASFVLEQFVFVAASDYELVESTSGKAVPLQTLSERDVLALSAIGNPRAFEQTLTRFGARVQSARFADHHAYTTQDLRSVLGRAHQSRAVVVMTEKDWVKIEPLSFDKTNAYVLRLNLKFPPDQRQRLAALVDGVFA